LGRIFSSRGEIRRLERELSASRPEPRAGFLNELGQQISESTADSRRRSPSQIAFALALTTLALGTFASFGGVGYAASSAVSTANVVKHAIAHKPAARHTSAAAQYGPASPPAPPARVAAAEHTAGTGGVAAAQTLPFTGLSLLVTAIVGFSLLLAGLFLRRQENRR
jgi:hypothetical protein